MAAVRGLGIALGIFLASFVLHIVGGATGQAWLFAIAVTLIFISATAFPVIAFWIAGLRDWRTRDGRVTVSIGTVTGYVLTVAALWAADGRAFAWWEFPLAIVLVGASSFVLLRLRLLWLILRGKDQPRRQVRPTTIETKAGEQASR